MFFKNYVFGKRTDNTNKALIKSSSCIDSELFQKKHKLFFGKSNELKVNINIKAHD